MSRVAKSHPKHSLMHKYWGRKPHNIVSYYINKFSKEGDTVLDPFLGSGGVVIESNKLNRNSIGVDLNPMSKFITENTLSLIDLNELKIEYKKIIESIPQEIKGLYDTKIDRKKYIITNSVWNEDEIIKIKAIREKDKVIKEPSEEDRRLIDVSSKLLKKYEDNSNLFYPKDEMLKYVKRSGKTHINQLFSDRNIFNSSCSF